MAGQEKLDIERHGDLVVVKLPVTVATFNPPVADLVMQQIEEQLVDPGLKMLVADLRDINTCGTNFLTLLVRLHIRTKKCGKRLRLCELSSFVDSALRLASIASLFEIHKYRDEAMGEDVTGEQDA